MSIPKRLKFHNYNGRLTHRNARWMIQEYQYINSFDLKKNKKGVIEAEGKWHQWYFLKTSDSLWNTNFSESKMVAE